VSRIEGNVPRLRAKSVHFVGYLPTSVQTKTTAPPGRRGLVLLAWRVVLTLPGLMFLRPFITDHYIFRPSERFHHRTPENVPLDLGNGVRHRLEPAVPTFDLLASLAVISVPLP
jgi:hypothetical protein